MRCVGLICLLVGLLFADNVNGIRPRESGADYPAHTAAGVGVGVGDGPNAAAPPRPASTDRPRQDKGMPRMRLPGMESTGGFT